MKQMERTWIVIAFLGLLAVFGIYSEAKADTLTTWYIPGTETLRVDFVGSRIPTWGCNDVEGVQWDRLVLDEVGRPQIELVFFGRNAHETVPLWVNRLPGSLTITFQGTAREVGCDVDFSVRARVYVGDDERWLYWPISDASATSQEPTPAEFNGINVVVDHNSTSFRTVCH